MKILLSSLILLWFKGIQVQCLPVTPKVVPSDINILDPIEVSALGRIARLGQFYDVRTEQFLNLSIFEGNIPNNTIKLTWNQSTTWKYKLVNIFEENLRVLNISDELKLNFLLGLVAPKASGRFFQNTRAGTKNAKALLIQNFVNVYEQVLLLDKSLQLKINCNLLSEVAATHVVVGIQWGGNMYISIEDIIKENPDVKNFHGELGAIMEKLKLILSSASIGTEEELLKLNKYSFSIGGDLVPKVVPQTLLEVLEFLKQSPELLEANLGKGNPIKYVLLPLVGLRKFWNVPAKTTIPINSSYSYVHNNDRYFL